jgi:hypothetical protein
MLPCLTAVHFISSLVGVVVGDTVLKTVNGGRTWVKQFFPAIDQFLTSVFFWMLIMDGSELRVGRFSVPPMERTGQPGNPTS